MELAESSLELRMVSPTHAGMLFWPEFGGAALTALLFGAIFFTRYTPVLAISGLLVLGGAGVVLTGAASGGDALILVGSGGIGLGVGASVSPAIFVTGFSLPSPQLPRVLALVELLRGVAAFLTAPLLLHLAATVGPRQAVGIETATWVAVGVALGGATLAAGIFSLGRARLQRPDVGPWLDGEKAGDRVARPLPLHPRGGSPGRTVIGAARGPRSRTAVSRSGTGAGACTSQPEPSRRSTPRS